MSHFDFTTVPDYWLFIFCLPYAIFIFMLSKEKSFMASLCLLLALQNALFILAKIMYA